MTLYALPQPFEELDHTADTGVLVQGDSAEEALARLVLAFTQLVTGGGQGLRATTTEAIEVTADGRVDVAIDVLRELLFRFDCEGEVVVSCRVLRFDEQGAQLEVGFAGLDERAHAQGTELKAVTLHDARFEHDGNWVAQIIFDV